MPGKQSVIDIAIDNPAFGQLRVSNELKKQGIIVSPGGARSIWLRNDLNNIKKRLKVLEAKVAQDGIMLTESQLQVLEKQKATKVEHHAFALFLSIEDIEHSKTKAYSPQTNGICEGFHKTMKEEFYDTAFRKKIYTSLEELQPDVDIWLNYYNEDRPHYSQNLTDNQTM